MFAILIASSLLACSLAQPILPVATPTGNETQTTNQSTPAAAIAPVGTTGQQRPGADLQGPTSSSPIQAAPSTGSQQVPPATGTQGQPQPGQPQQGQPLPSSQAQPGPVQPGPVQLPQGTGPQTGPTQTVNPSQFPVQQPQTSVQPQLGPVASQPQTGFQQNAPTQTQGTQPQAQPQPQGQPQTQNTEKCFKTTDEEKKTIVEIVTASVTANGNSQESAQDIERKLQGKLGGKWVAVTGLEFHAFAPDYKKFCLVLVPNTAAVYVANFE